MKVKGLRDPPPPGKVALGLPPDQDSMAQVMDSQCISFVGWISTRADSPELHTLYVLEIPCRGFKGASVLRVLPILVMFPRCLIWFHMRRFFPPR